MICPVCRSPGSHPFVQVEDRAYHRCPICEATFLDPDQLPDRGTELAHYRLHENAVDDPGYRRFLAKLCQPLLERLPPGSRGLDYGCGPGPALAAMLREAGHEVRLYDPFFHDDPSALLGPHDFITCTEVIEHFHRPADEFDGLDKLLLPGGWLAVMTCFQTEDARFPDWHYRRDPTHVVFYRAATLEFIAERRGWRCEIPVKDVALMRKPG